MGGYLSLALLIVGISLFLVGIAILDRCNKIISSIQWLQRRFMGEAPPVAPDKHPHLALEFFTIKEKLAPLFFMPLASAAIEIKQMYETVDKQFTETLELWKALEREEMETFSGTNPPDGKVFLPSENLKRALRSWASERHKANLVEKWAYLFTEIYVELLSGKIHLSEAEDRLRRVDPMILRIRDPIEVGKIFNSWASNWEGDNWKKRLNHLRQMERWKKTSK